MSKTPMELANEALDADQRYLESLPPQVRFACGTCGRPMMRGAQRLRDVQVNMDQILEELSE